MFYAGDQYFNSITKYENLLFIPILKWLHGCFYQNICKPCKEMDENSTLFWLFLLLNIHGDNLVYNKIKIIGHFFRSFLYKNQVIFRIYMDSVYYEL